MGWNRLVLGSGRRGIPGWFRGRRAGSGTLEVVLVPPKCWLFQEWGAPGVSREFFGSFSGVLCPCFHKHPALPWAHPRKKHPQKWEEDFWRNLLPKNQREVWNPLWGCWNRSWGCIPSLCSPLGFRILLQESSEQRIGDLLKLTSAASCQAPLVLCSGLDKYFFILILHKREKSHILRFIISELCCELITAWVFQKSHGGWAGRALGKL